jgi:hypothetical protein
MRFRFTIRHLLWLTALVALGLAWWAWEKKWIIDRHTAMNAPRKGYLDVTPHVFLHWWKDGNVVPWHLSLFGERKGYSKIQLGRDIDTPADEERQAIAKMQSLFPEAEVYVILPAW